MTQEREKELKKWLEKEKNKPCQYVGGIDDLQNVCLDGWFNLEELVDTIMKSEINKVLEGAEKRGFKKGLRWAKQATNKLYKQ